jgi:hypothetical protein
VHDIVQDFKAVRAKTVGELCGVLTALFDQFGEALLTERAQRRPNLDRARTSRQFRGELRWLAIPGNSLGEIGGAGRHGRAQVIGTAHERQPAVVGNV